MGDVARIPMLGSADAWLRDNSRFRLCHDELQRQLARDSWFSDTAFPCASVATLPKTDAFACGAAGLRQLWLVPDPLAATDVTGPSRGKAAKKLRAAGKLVVSSSAGFLCNAFLCNAAMPFSAFRQILR